MKQLSVVHRFPVTGRNVALCRTLHRVNINVDAFLVSATARTISASQLSAQLLK